MNRLKGWLRAFWPDPMAVSRGEQLLSCSGALLGLLVSGWIAQQSLGDAGLWLVAPMGACAVLLFAVPSSPLAQPWSVVGGNLVAALVGVACAHWVGHTLWAAGLAVAIAMAAMFGLRCLHPPGGAIALTAVLGGDEVAQLGYAFALYPVTLNSLGLLAIALLFNNAFRRRYPYRALVPDNPRKTRDLPPRDRLGFTAADLDEVLAARGELLDISREDLAQILRQTEERAYRRRFGEIRCADIMSRDVLCLAPADSCAEAWARMQGHRLTAMPVVNQRRQLQGMLYLHDLIQTDGACSPGQVREVMQTQVPSCGPQWPTIRLVQRLASGEVHKVPVLDEDRVLLGIVTQTDLVAALYRRSLETVSAGTLAPPPAG
ncbi:HPP family protein [Pseudomonas benzenivorans]|uniref:HPP family protein n=1 Tax=Pseudomonas benzenivorans TaxID=556533 RepID=A0ABY5H4W2_9PSED|nr:HPP family protein [Pseudomonas benzenivorans]UTW06821.1 HPP family protein [Pseudomonas benzenivorans]